ncbi:MAG: DUF2252 family protein [Candidatus Riflebacteria bacterium]|nr:DUF2252 family protein [Candidatus Riflebacteria bacterium]
MRTNLLLLWLIAALLLAPLSPALAKGDAALARDAVAAVREFNRALARQDPDGVRQKFAKMAEDAFAFYRGTADLFYRDLVDRSAPWAADVFAADAPVCWLTGDCHVQNFATRRLPDGRVVFDYVDLDEAMPAPYLWDLRRLAASLALAAKVSNLGHKVGVEASSVMAGAYVRTLDSLAQGDSAASLVIDAAHAEGKLKSLLEDVAATDGEKWLAKKLDKADRSRFRESDEVQRVQSAPFVPGLNVFAGGVARPRSKATGFFTLKDAARRLAKGIGSLGRQRFFLLLEGPASGWSDDVVLELKQSGPSVLAPYVKKDGAPAPDAVDRVLEAYRHLCPRPPVLLGKLSLEDGRQFLAKPLTAFEEKYDLADPGDEDDFSAAAAAMGTLLARSHATAGAAKTIRARIGERRREFQDSLSEFSAAYYEQAKADFKAFRDAIEASPMLGLGKQ